MNRKTMNIILISVAIAILVCSIIFGTIVTCVSEQKPLITFDMPLKNAILQGVADNYDYFVKTEVATREFNNTKPYEYNASIIFIADESLGNTYKLDFWHCKYLMRSQTEGMCLIKDITTIDLEDYLNRDHWRPFYIINDEIKVYTIDTFAHFAHQFGLYFDSYFVITASQAVIDKISERDN